MSRITRSTYARKREAYAQLLRELEVALLERELHQEWQEAHCATALHHTAVTSNGRAVVQVTVRLSIA
jgi:hypothetical protein